MIGQRLLEIASAQPELPAVVVRNTPMSYGRLVSAGGEVRRRLEAMGVRAGDAVVCALPVCWEAVAGFVGCALLGAVYTPVNPAWSREESAWLVKRVGPAAALAASDDAWVAAGLDHSRVIIARDWSWPDIASVGEYGAGFEDDRPIAYQLSSGSTGEPKIVVKSSSRFLASMQAVASVVDMRPGRRILVTTPFHFGFSFSWQMLLPLVSGATMVLLEKFDPGEAAEVITRQQVQCLWGSPVLYGLLSGAHLPEGSLGGLELCITGGASVSAEVKEQWSRLGGAALRQAYGTTEAGMIAIQREDEAPEGCVGLPPPGTEIRIYDGDRIQPAGEPGEIAVRGPGVMSGYLDDDAATAALMTDRFLRTGDAGWLDEQGRLYFEGRMRPWINAGGIKIDPAEVQNVLRKMPGVRDCMVRGEPGPRGFEIVAANIAAEPGVELSRAEVVAHCRGYLAEYKIPRIVRFVAALSDDLTGKTRVRMLHSR